MNSNFDAETIYRDTRARIRQINNLLHDLSDHLDRARTSPESINQASTCARKALGELKTVTVSVNAAAADTNTILENPQ